MSASDRYEEQQAARTEADEPHGRRAWYVVHCQVTLPDSERAKRQTTGAGTLAVDEGTDAHSAAQARIRVRGRLMRRYGVSARAVRVTSVEKTQDL